MGRAGIRPPRARSRQSLLTALKSRLARAGQVYRADARTAYLPRPRSKQKSRNTLRRADVRGWQERAACALLEESADEVGRDFRLGLQGRAAARRRRPARGQRGDTGGA